MSRTDLTGQTIDTYRIEARLGVGGMGQVYRAVHVHLDRQVAIKIMHPHLAEIEGFHARFLQEARAAAALNHPNIVQVYDFDEYQGMLYLVMELVSDGSMRSVLDSVHRNSWMPSGWRLSDGLELIAQTADGLAAAHASDMIHRDIKPDNLLLRQLDGYDESHRHYQVKIADFGIAKMAEGVAYTAAGMMLGSPNYMSPEQCQGLELDGRSDIYALGVVLYEMVTGVTPFDSKTPAETILKHISTAPQPPREIDPAVPIELQEIVLKCLAKSPEDRFNSATDLASTLRVLAPLAETQETAYADDPVAGSGASSTGAPPPAPPMNHELASQDGGRSWWWFGLLALIPIVVLAAWLASSAILDDSGEGGTGEDRIVAFMTHTPTATESSAFATETGTSVVPTTETLSPTSTSTESARPTPTPIVPTPTPDVPTYQIAFESAREGDPDLLGLYIMNGDGTDVRNVTSFLDPLSTEAWSPAWSPDGKRLVFASTLAGNDDLFVVDIDGSNLRQLTTDPASDQSPTWSHDGRFIAFQSNRDGNWEIYVMEADGSNPVNLTNSQATDWGPTWSPDDARIAFVSNRDGNDDIFVMNSDGSDQVKITNSVENEGSPAWSPDGTMIAYEWNGGADSEIFVMNADGSDQRRITDSPADDSIPAWSPDGLWIAFRTNRDENSEIYKMMADGSNATRLTFELTWDSGPTWSPIIGGAGP